MASELQVTTIKGVPTGANANQILVGSGQTFIGGSGSIIQVKSIKLNGASQTISTDSWTASNHPSLSITTKQANSELLINAMGARYEIDNQAADKGICYTFFVNINGGGFQHATDYLTGGTSSAERFLQFEYRTNAYPNLQGALSLGYRFNPSSSAAGTTYEFKIYTRGWNANSVQPVKYDGAGAVGHFQIMEIAQ